MQPKTRANSLDALQWLWQQSSTQRVLRKYLNIPVKSRHTLTISFTQLYGVQAQVLDHSLAGTQWAGDVVRQTWYLHLCKRVRLMLLENYCCWFNIVHGARTTAGFPLRLSRKEDEKARRKKEERKEGRATAFQSASSQPAPSRTALFSVSWVVRLVARQRYRHGYEQRKPPVRVWGIAASAETRWKMRRYHSLCLFL